MVKKELLHCAVLKKQLAEKRPSLQTEKEKSIFAQCTSGKLIKKYKLQKDTTCIVSKYLQRKHMNSSSIVYKRSAAKQEAMKTEIIKSVEKFLEKDENSALASGVKDTITKNKITKRKRFLLDSIDNLYCKYKKEEAIKLSRSTFFRYKPFWVVNRKVTDRDTCLCKTHVNMKLLIQKLFYLKLLPSISTLSFIQSRVCDILNKECLYGQCIDCKKKSLIFEENKDSTWYYKWSTHKESRLGSKNLTYNVNITSKEKIICTVDDLVREVNTQIPEYFKHSYDTGHQHKALENIRMNLKEGEVLIVIDFSENYICKYNEEIQSVHFGTSKKQLSLQTGAFYYKDTVSKEILCISFCTVSEHLRHDAAAVWAHLNPVMTLIKNTIPLNTVHFQSDGPSSQYKNKSNFFLFRLYCQEINLDHGTWNFSTPGHGKSTADGIGGTVKGMCDRAVARGKDVLSAEGMVNIINTCQSQKIHAFVILQADIEKIDGILPPKMKSVSNTKRTFQVTWSKTNSNKLFLNSLSCSYCINNGLYDSPCTHFFLNLNDYFHLKNKKMSCKTSEMKKVKSAKSKKKVV